LRSDVKTKPPSGAKAALYSNRVSASSLRSFDPSISAIWSSETDAVHQHHALLPALRIGQQTRAGLARHQSSSRNYAQKRAAVHLSLLVGGLGIAATHPC
jgi:hypothetical protein